MIRPIRCTVNELEEIKHENKYNNIHIVNNFHNEIEYKKYKGI